MIIYDNNRYLIMSNIKKAAIPGIAALGSLCHRQ
jgi:hypothetical protein